MSQTEADQQGAYRILDPAESALDTLAQLIVDRERDHLPDLSQVTIILDNPYAATQLRHCLLKATREQGYSALLGPHIQTLQSWATEHTAQSQPVISQHARELLLVAALENHPDLYGKASPWSLAASLLELFDELSRAALPLPDSLQDFQTQIEQAYGENTQQFAALNREANLVYSLWRAMAEQVSALNMEESYVNYVRMLRTTIENVSEQQSLYILPATTPSQAEHDCLQRLLARNNTCILSSTNTALSGRAEPITATDSPYLSFINAALEARSPALVTRAAEFAERCPESPALGRLSIYLSEGAEQEAEAVELQTRLWLLEGKKNIGIITEDRRLARRVRALLERANVTPEDAGGWALSTTSAATALERWLQCMEEDFHHQAFLDLLKSPFIFPEQDREALLATVYRFEQGVVRGENIANNLQRYRQAMESRRKRLAAEQSAYYDAVFPLLEQIDSAAKPLLNLVNSQLNKPGEYLEALVESIAGLGLGKNFAQDAAGQRILELISELAVACQQANLAMDWLGFRTWLGRALEITTFHPPSQRQSVQILSLRQSQHLNFDAVIVAAMEQDAFPAIQNTSPFFNEGVRSKLGLRTREQRLAEAYVYFRNLLANGEHQSAPCLLTARRIDNGEDIQAAPWLEGLRVFHQLAYSFDLLDIRLAQMLPHNESKVQPADQSLPSVSRRPQPSINPAILPVSVSASAYQSLLDCPYQFYAGRCLQLIPSEDVRSALSKADYGERVHLCLQAFHSPVSRLPGPFPEPLNAANRDKAESLMLAIAEAVFREDIEDNFMHRGWLNQWKSCIPAYLQWQIERNTEWSIKQTEMNSVNTLDTDVNIHGRLDRIDTHDAKVAVVDYKTGSTSTMKDIESGESIQLPFYALLLEDDTTRSTVERVEYLCVDKQSANSKAVLEGDQLGELSRAIGKRLVDVIQGLRDGAAAPASGDEKTCSRCVMEGVCRRQSWQENSESII